MCNKSASYPSDSKGCHPSSSSSSSLLCWRGPPHQTPVMGKLLRREGKKKQNNKIAINTQGDNRQRRVALLYRLLTIVGVFETGAQSFLLVRTFLITEVSCRPLDWSLPRSLDDRLLFSTSCLFGTSSHPHSPATFALDLPQSLCKSSGNRQGR